ncbi:MAG: DUF2062 domain-containing protein [Candidatus Omnitrophica bacterium]|nr:DUF2062 domain-containing protein [Candidatus Omnitrophota bacterium]
MVNKPVMIVISRFLKAVYLKIFRINDTPQKIALGLGLGVFMGVLPGTGPIAALALALLFRVNRASALLGSILTNTWLSIPVFLLSLRTGAVITGVSYQALKNDWSLLIKDFHWATLLDLGVYKILMPILAGYALISLSIGIIAYALTLIVVVYGRRKKIKII